MANEQLNIPGFLLNPIADAPQADDSDAEVIDLETTTDTTDEATGQPAEDLYLAPEATPDEEDEQVPELNSGDEPEADDEDPSADPEPGEAEDEPEAIQDAEDNDGASEAEPAAEDDELEAMMHSVRRAAGVEPPEPEPEPEPEPVAAPAPIEIPDWLLHPAGLSRHKEPEQDEPELAQGTEDEAQPAAEEATAIDKPTSEAVEPAAEVDDAEAEPDVEDVASDYDEPESEATDEAEAKDAEEQDTALEDEPTSAQDAEDESPEAIATTDDPEPTPDPYADPDSPSLEADLDALNDLERHIFAHRYASYELETFGETIDPVKATADRSEAMAVLVEEDHARMSDPAVGALLDRLSAVPDRLDPLTARQVTVLIRDREQLTSVSAADNAELVRLQSAAYDVWRKGKATGDWASFSPYLDRLVALRKKMALAKNPDADPYDTLLDEFEHGTNRAFYNAFFAQVKQCVVPLLSSISMSPRKLSRACVEGHFDEGRQWELARDVARLEGIDEDAHYLTATEHPFSCGMTSNYVVTAAHVDGDDLMSNIYTMLHEVGHNLYEQGVDPKLNRTSLAGGTSSGIHEAQSRFFENYIGRDRAFIRPLLDIMKQRFPGQLGRVTPNQLYMAVNAVEPSFIRVDADELTYPLHIIVRYEIEQDLMSGEATADDVPALWADKYRRYLGVSVTNNSLGALQDVHWSQGSFGYFPTYALGNAYAAQLRAQMIGEGIDWQGCLSAGDLAPIRAWLRQKVWQFGRAKDPAQIIEDACGKPFDPVYYTDYLSEKFSALYGLR